MAQQELVYQLDEIQAIAEQLLQLGKDFTIWSFSGQMGAGKTSLIKALCAALGVEDKVHSPTYALVHEYEARPNGKPMSIYHSDWYRLEDAAAARAAGIEDLLNESSSLHFIEWGSKAPELLKRKHLCIDIEVIDANQRRIIVDIRY